MKISSALVLINCWDNKNPASVNKRTSGRGCPYCAGQKVCYSNCLSTLYPDVSMQWHPTKNGDLTPATVIPGSHKKYWWLCNVSPTHEWTSTVSNRTKNKNGCPFCDNSKGEMEISCVLRSLGVKFDIEKTFPTCRDQGLLFFDFCVQTKNGHKLIEYQGVQHYKPTFGSNPHDVFAGTQRRDNIKREWCKQNGIDLLEIPYWHFSNIDSIVRKFISF